MTIDLNRRFSKQDIQWLKAYGKKMLNITNHQEMQMKTTVRYCLTTMNGYY